MKLSKNKYYIQGIPVEKIAKDFGTPLYVYDGEKIIQQIEKLKASFSEIKVKIKYAAKALTNISILKLVRKQGVGMDAVSINEAMLGIKAGYQPHEILYTPNCVSFNEIQQAVEMGLMINIDNISILEQFGNTYGHEVPCCIRLNPHIMAGGNAKISTGHVDSKFGISFLQRRHIQRIVKTYNLNITGLHMHTGSDILDSEVFLKGAEIVFDFASDFTELQFLDLGSGFKVGYREGDATTDIPSLAKAIKNSFRQFCKEYGRELELWFEPGKFIVSESGLLLVKTNVVKTTPATVFAGVDSGMNHLIRPMMYDAYHDMLNISNPNGIKRVYTIVGYICETDTLGWDRQLNEVREGDVIAIKNAGAYGFSMASNYNSRLRPAEVLVLDGKAHLIREREKFDDLTRHQVELDI